MLFNCLCMSIMNLHCYFFLPTRSCLANQIRLTILALLSMWIVYILLFLCWKWVHCWFMRTQIPLINYNSWWPNKFLFITSIILPFLCLFFKTSQYSRSIFHFLFLYSWSNMYLFCCYCISKQTMIKFFIMLYYFLVQKYTTFYILLIFVGCFIWSKLKTRRKCLCFFFSTSN
jgi:hypothetical protein